MMIPDIDIEDYNYGLSDDRIAKYPLPERDSSKLLEYRDGKVIDHTFIDIPDLLPDNSLMIFNDTRVVPARLHFQRESGAHIEIFCLEPVLPVEYNLIFAESKCCRWKCIIGNAKRWKGDLLHLYNPESSDRIDELNLHASLVEREAETGVVEFSWNGGIPFSNVLEICGSIPIPPYLNRNTESIDYERYQTLYAHIRGSVAAPTAGLHFTQSVLDRIKEKGIEEETVCLHVGAGTFLPVKSGIVAEHTMHREPISVSLELVEKLASAEKSVVAVGTTSVRTLESLYYIGVSIIENGEPQDVRQWAPYDREYTYSTVEAFEAIAAYLRRTGKKAVEAGTRIIIVPGFKFRVVEYLVTNFHQPESTLILLVSAFLDGDWRTVYDHALNSGYRFLSYGDSSILKRVK